MFKALWCVTVEEVSTVSIFDLVHLSCRLWVRRANSVISKVDDNYEKVISQDNGC